MELDHSQTHDQAHARRPYQHRNHPLNTKIKSKFSLYERKNKSELYHNPILGWIAASKQPDHYHGNKLYHDSIYCNKKLCYKIHRIDRSIEMKYNARRVEEFSKNQFPLSFTNIEKARF